MDCALVLLHALGGVGSVGSFGVGHLRHGIGIGMLVWVGWLIDQDRGVGW